MELHNLGLVLDDRLSWKEQVYEVCKRTNTLMYRLYRLRDSTTLVLRKHLIQAFLWPLVDYCSLAYCNISKEQDKRLQVLMNTGIRYVLYECGKLRSCGTATYDDRFITIQTNI